MHGLFGANVTLKHWFLRATVIAIRISFDRGSFAPSVFGVLATSKTDSVCPHSFLSLRHRRHLRHLYETFSYPAHLIQDPVPPDFPNPNLPIDPPLRSRSPIFGILVINSSSLGRCGWHQSPVISRI
ncbi:hypothetical protein SAY87_020711 [Trapa incisa]|uniref:Uncharacterized protein n=1 Tax=Trapa incisa TaxID=236973 RepID=A0AAN7JW50_9MYRT|nr:hypothetical protein SAY87_020711 [Trapa incisa]